MPFRPRAIRRPLPAWTGAAAGVGLAVAASLAAARLFAGTAFSTMLPLAFIAVLFVLGRRYGLLVAVLGSILCAFIFAHFLFQPTGNWRVGDMAARTSLLWMVVGTVAVSYLFAPAGPEDRSQD